MNPLTTWAHFAFVVLSVSGLFRPLDLAYIHFPPLPIFRPLSLPGVDRRLHGYFPLIFCSDGMETWLGSVNFGCFFAFQEIYSLSREMNLAAECIDSRRIFFLLSRAFRPINRRTNHQQLSL